ncbi:MAG: hypothetical protein J6T57_00795 [Alphaproteobacteria bacterium]|nr:hypothetical protein [Alphaproteobacteria bacterium]
MLKFFSWMLFGIVSTAAFASVDWWEHVMNGGTVCQVDNTPCWSGVTVGVDMEEWDVSGKCRGKKYICGDALDPVGDAPVLMERADVLGSVGISTDYDTFVLNGDCYGVRKTMNNNTMVSVDGRYVRVWCSNIDLAPEVTELSNGHFTNGNQPKCQDLADQGCVATLNGQCYGQCYSPTEYVVQCDGELATLIRLNGANYTPGGDGMTAAMASNRFNAMVSSASSRRAVHFDN